MRQAVSANMMRTLLQIGFLLASISSFAQFDKLTIEFHPSFIENSTLAIEKQSDEFVMTIETESIEESVMVSKSNLTQLDSLLSVYNFEHKGAIDTIGYEKVIENGDTVVYYQLSMGCDGIDVYGKLVKANSEKTFKFWSPDKEDKNHELIQILFGIMYKQFDNQNTTNYMELLEQYFDFGLGLRKLNDNPLTYKLYGTISSNELEELYAFFESLPIDERVYIDMSNFNGMGTMFDEDFLELSESHKLITWINCSVSAKQTLKRAEIKRNRYK